MAALGSAVLITLDTSMTSTAIPSIAESLGTSPATTIWIVNLYFLANVACLLPLGALGDILGQRRICLAGLGGVCVGALLCGLAPSLAVLMAGRALVGIGAAAIATTTPALVRVLYRPEQLNRGLGTYAMVVGVALAVGPTVASMVLALADWHALYLAMAPVAVAMAVLAWWHLPETAPKVRPFDRVSASLCAGMFAALQFAIAGAAQIGPASAAAAAVLALALGIVLARREVAQAVPILAFDLFRMPLFALSSATSACAFSIQGLVFVVLPLLLRLNLGYGAADVGLLILPWPLTLAVMTFVAAPLAQTVSPGLLGGAGLLMVAAGLGSLALTADTASAAWIAGHLVWCGVGFGLFQSPNMVALMRSAPPERSGGAGGVLAASRLLGQSIGAASVAFCLSHWPATGSVGALWLGAAYGVIGAAVSLLRLAPFARRPASA